MSTGSIGAIAQERPQNSIDRDAFRDIDLDTFIELLITELQNQDPLSPLENHEILQQVSQIREIDSNQRLTTTLEAVLLGQSVATAGNLLGRTVVGLSEAGERVTGRVERVSIEDGLAKLHVGEQTIELNNIAEILPEGAT